MVHTPGPIALTIGEPAGIGPDVTLRAWRERQSSSLPPFFVIGDPRVLAERSERLHDPVPVAEIKAAAEASHVFAKGLPVLPLASPTEAICGKAVPETAPMVIGSIERAVALAIAGDVTAVVTNPVHKETLYKAGFAHPGHTEFLADLSRNAHDEIIPVMMMVAPGLRTVPLTIHVPLRDVPRLLTVELIVSRARIVAHALTRHFGVAAPHLALTGLNPHAGEAGRIGNEEQVVIVPAIDRLCAEGLTVSGPVPADTVFHEEARERFDAILCMYHDQALIPVKMLAFHEGVNCTLGLPFVRTSPDHGTALALAGTGRANPSSLIHALRLAWDMARRVAPEQPSA